MNVLEPRFTGRIIFQYFYDVGGDIEFEKIPKESFNIIERRKSRGARILAPRYEEIGLYSLDIDLGAQKLDRQKVTLSARIFPVGVIGVYVSLEFRNATFDSIIKLVGLSERKVKVAGKEIEFEQMPRSLFEELKQKIEPAIVHPYTPLEHPEVYTLILIASSDPPLDVQDFLTRFSKQTAGLLRGEKEWISLSNKEVEDALKCYLSYSNNDIVIIDWYAALITGATDYLDELVHMVELAKIQLLELKTYDKLLDQCLEQAYDSFRGVFSRPKLKLIWSNRRYKELSRAINELAELRVEILDLVEDTRNIAKFTGEWYLGKLYRLASERFRITDWLSFIDKKLDRLQELYTMAIEYVEARRATILEFLTAILVATIVVLDILLVFK